MQKNNLQIISLYLIILLSVQTNPSQSISNQTIDENVSSNIIVNQISSNKAFANIISILNNRQLDAGSWKLAGISTENRFYYGLSGGMAGMGMKLLEAMEQDASWVSPDMNQKLLDMAIDIASDLEAEGIINSSKATWEIYQNSGVIDTGYDFGLAGIASFYSKLYSHTSNNSYKLLAEKTLNSITSLVVNSSNPKWLSNIHNITENIGWFTTLDFSFYEDIGPTYYSGVSFGAAGIAKSSLEFLKYTGESSNNIANNLLNLSLLALENMAIVNGSETSYLLANDFIGLKSTSLSTGAAGIGDLFLDLYNYFNDENYLNQSMNVFNWLNGSVSDERRIFYSWEINGTLDENFELGLTTGLAGVNRYFLKLAKTLNDSTLLELTLNHLLYLKSFKNSNDQFGERVINDNVRRVGSNSWAYGSTGLYEAFINVGRFTSNTELLNLATVIKQRTLSQLKEENGIQGIITYLTGKIESNPSIGLPSFLSMLNYISEGVLSVEINTLEFQKTELGESSSNSIKLINLGETEISVDWTISEGPFTTDSTSMKIPGGEIQDLIIFFTPTVEKFYQGSLISIKSGRKTFIVNLNGFGIDLPTITPTFSVENNSVLIEHEEISYSIEIKDSSLIKNVILDLNGDTKEIFQNENTGKYSGKIDTRSFKNGLNTIKISATDSLNNVGEVFIRYNLSLPVTPIEQKIFSQENIVRLSVVTVGLLIIAIIVTKKYMK